MDLIFQTSLFIKLSKGLTKLQYDAYLETEFHSLAAGWTQLLLYSLLAELYTWGFLFSLMWESEDFVSLRLAWQFGQPWCPFSIEGIFNNHCKRILSIINYQSFVGQHCMLVQSIKSINIMILYCCPIIMREATRFLERTIGHWIGWVFLPCDPPKIIKFRELIIERFIIIQCP